MEYVDPRVNKILKRNKIKFISWNRKTGELVLCGDITKDSGKKEEHTESFYQYSVFDACRRFRMQHPLN